MTVTPAAKSTEATEATEDSTSDLPRLDWQTGLAPVCAKLAADGVARVGLQLPEGLRGQAAAIMDFVAKRLAEVADGKAGAGLGGGGDAEAAAGAAAAAGAGAAAMAEVTLWAEPTFGACDLADRPLAELGVEALIHLGHAPMPYHSDRYAIPVHFVPVAHTGGLTLTEAGLARLAELLGRDEGQGASGGGAEDGGAGGGGGSGASEGSEGDAGSGGDGRGGGGSEGGGGGGGRRVGLVTTAQHAPLLKALVGRLRAAGWEPLVGAGSRRLAFEGQLLGCNFSAAWALEKEVSGFLYLGTGRFHPLTVALGSKLPVAALDPHTGAVESVSAERFLRQRHAAVALGAEARRWAVLVCPQVGQCRSRLAERAVGQLEAAGRTAYRVAATHQAPEQLAGLEVEAAVVTSCPRLAIEEGPSWPVVLLTPPELELALGLREWDPEGSGYPFDEIL